jgi:hypothetical protein
MHGNMHCLRVRLIKFSMDHGNAWAFNYGTKYDIEHD